MSEHKYIEPILEAESRCWRGEQPLHNRDFSVKRLIDEHMEAQIGKPSRQTQGWIHPSGMGFCLRSSYYDSQDAPALVQHLPKDRKLMDVGTALHEVWQQYIKDALGEDPEEFVDELPVRYKAFQTSQRIDGIFWVKDWVLEIKTVSDKAFGSLNRPRPKDLMQAHVYMWILDIPRAIIYYINRNNGADKEFPVTFDKKVWEKVMRILQAIDWHERNGSLPKRLDSKFWCASCKYKKHCFADKEGEDAPAAVLRG